MLAAGFFHTTVVHMKPRKYTVSNEPHSSFRSSETHGGVKPSSPYLPADRCSAPTPSLFLYTTRRND